MPQNPTRRTLTLAMLASALAAPAFAQAALSPADQALVDRAAACLQGMTQARGRFVQIDGRGQTSQGELFLSRPGKARFAYDPPSRLLVVSDGAVVSVADSRLKTFDRYPLSATPLSLFLARTVRLDKNVTVTRVVRRAGAFDVTLRDGRKQTAGQLTLSFSETPVALIGWTVTDAQMRSTQVRLTDLRPANDLDPQLFVLKNPKPSNLGRAKM